MTSELQLWLDKLGAMSVQDIRKLMQDEGISGIVGSPRGCPVALFLRRQCRADVSVYYAGVTDGINGFSSQLPDSVGVFVDQFDRQQYPELIV